MCGVFGCREHEDSMDALQQDIESLEAEKTELKEKIKAFSMKSMFAGITRSASGRQIGRQPGKNTTQNCLTLCLSISLSLFALSLYFCLSLSVSVSVCVCFALCLS